MSIAAPARWLAALALMMGGMAMVPADAGPVKAPLRTAAAWSTSADGTRRLTPGSTIEWRAGAAPADLPTVVVDAGKADQAMVGFGAAMTDASAQLFMQSLTPDRRTALFRELFGDRGIALSFVRVPIGSSDFSTRHYSLDDMAAGQRDPALTRFSMAGPLVAQIPALKAARRINPQLTLMASPWSAPGWMKDSDSLIKGHLRPDAYDAYARYFVRYLDAMKTHGLTVGWISVQNEPDFEPENYPGMRFPPEARAAFIGGYLGPMLAAKGMAPRILDWDHNWDHPENPLALLKDPVARRYVAGVAWHCYGGTPEVMADVRTAYPDKQVFFSECSGGEWAPDWGGTLGWMTDNLMIAPVRSGSRGTLLWNLALDQDHGPHLGGCGDCRGVVTIDTRTGAVTRNVEYYVLGQFSRFVRPGARRIASTEPGAVRNAAFRNPDGSVVVVLHNSGGESVRMATTMGDGHAILDLPGGEVATLVLSPEPRR